MEEQLITSLEEQLITSLISGKHEISKMMLKYRATPWCKCIGSPESESDGEKKLKYRACKDCMPPVTSKDLPPQSHGGDLFQHSQWSALYLEKWFNDTSNEYHKLKQIINDVVNSPLFNTIISDDQNKKIRFLQLCGFLHDIGKGGDCSENSDLGNCEFYDMYSNTKWAGVGGEQFHPAICKQITLEPGMRYDGQLQILMDEITQPGMYKDGMCAKVIISLCGALHWEFGKLNIPAGNGGITENQYIDKIIDEINTVNTRCKIDLKRYICTLTKLFMAVSCADIAAASNEELLGHEDLNIRPAKEIYVNEGGAWKKYDFRTEHKRYIDSVLEGIRLRYRPRCGLPAAGGKKKRKSIKIKSIKRKSIKRKSIKRRSIKRKSIKRRSMKRDLKGRKK